MKQHEMAEAIYWEVLNTLGNWNDCVRMRHDEDGLPTAETENTELGTELYYAIEAVISEHLKED